MQTEPEDRKYSLVELVGDHFTRPRGRFALKFWVLSREAWVSEALRLHRNQNAILAPIADDEQNAVVSIHSRRHVEHVATNRREWNRCSDRAPGAREWRVIARLEADAGRAAVTMLLDRVRSHDNLDTGGSG